jgi:hypothetical protein
VALHTGNIGFIDEGKEVLIVDLVNEIIKVKGFLVKSWLYLTGY